MQNTVCLVGKVSKTYKQDDELYVILDVKRSYKNYEGVFLVDSIKCRIWKSAIRNCDNKYSEGINLAVSGRLCNENDNYYVDCYDVQYLGN